MKRPKRAENQAKAATAGSPYQLPDLRDRIRLSPPVHNLLYLSRFVGLRDRLRCPECSAVGTWKMHGGFIDGICDWVEAKIKGEGPAFPRRPVRRWLCKWCGHYLGPEGVNQAFPNEVWRLPEPGLERTPTPAEVLAEHMGKTWPWRG